METLEDSDRDQEPFDGDEMKIAKNVENLGDAAFVKAKGTWYRARKCHKVRLGRMKMHRSILNQPTHFQRHFYTTIYTSRESSDEKLK